MTRRDLLLAGLSAPLTGLAPPAPMPLAPTPPGLRIAPDREAMVPVPGGRVYVRVNGGLGGRPPLVLVHGGPGSSHWYFLNATALADERAVILYDQLDCGRSETPGDPANWRTARFVAELDAIAAHFGIGRWHVLGASWGGTIGLEYGARSEVDRPARLASLILQSPLIATEAWLADAARLKAAMPDGVRQLLDLCDTPGAAPADACQAATDAFYARHVRMRAPPPAVAAYRDALPRSFSADLYNHMWGRAEFTSTGTLRDYDGRPLLPRLDGGRTLFVTGQHDEATPATVAGFASAAGARFAEVADAAHSIFNDNPSAYLDLLRPWLRAHD